MADYLIEFFIANEITDVFGYPGGMVTQLMDSFGKYSDRISVHVTYHEQAAAFAACGYAQTSGKPGVAYATSGPGATNLITGIANAFFDSIPTIFITGQVNSNEAKGAYGVRQRGFQETDIVSMVKPVTKYAVYISSADNLPSEIEKAYQIAMSGRRGPVLLDIPMNVFRSVIEVEDKTRMEDIRQSAKDCHQTDKYIVQILNDALKNASAPVFLVGQGVKSLCFEDRVSTVLRKMNIPIISSMIAFDVMKNAPNYYGFLGAYGSRTANFIAAKGDLIITLGSRLDIRQVGLQRDRFAPNAKIIRCDVDEGELEYRVHDNETQICMDLDCFVEALDRVDRKRFDAWNTVCTEIKDLLDDIDDNHMGRLIDNLSEIVPDGAVITTDVGQNQVWVAQSFKVKPHQKVLFSGGHGAMGYSLPAAIGAFYGSGKKPVYCITGDGGMQMNIQELQYIKREQLPIKIIVLNNNALGMIRHFQELYFDSRYIQTKPEGGYTAPNFARISEAYGIRGSCIETKEINDYIWTDEPELIEIMIRENTYVIPKLEFGKPNQDQEPLINRELYERIMNMKPENTEKTMRGGYWLSRKNVLCSIPSVLKEQGWAA